MRPFARTSARILERAGLVLAIVMCSSDAGASEPVPGTIARIPDRILFQVVDPGAAEDLPPGNPRDASQLDAAPFSNDPELDLPESKKPPVPGSPGDWGEATSGDERISELIRAHWVSLTADGRLLGRISTINEQTLQLIPTPGLSVRFLQEGTVRAETQTDEQGRFEALNLDPGVYTVTATGPGGLLAYTLNILGFEEAEQRRQSMLSGDWIQLAQLEGVEATLEIDAAAVPPTFHTVKSIAQEYYPQMAQQTVELPGYDRVIQDDVRDRVPGANDPSGPARRRGIQELQQALPEARPATSIRQHRVELTPGGVMLGRLHSIDQFSGRPKMVEDVNVFLIQDDRLVDQVRVDKYGTFEIPGLVPGVYSLVAAGEDGFGAVGFQLARAQEDDQAWRPRRDEFRLVAFRRPRWDARLVAQGAGGLMPFPFAMSIVDDPRDVRAIFNPLLGRPQEALADANALADAALPPVPPVAPMGGQGSNGGGGGGGGGGFSGLGAAGLLGAALALPAILNNNNNNNGGGNNGGGGGPNPNPQPVSPFQPGPSNPFQ